MKKVLSIILATMLSMHTLHAVIKIHTIGDSTMETYDESATDKRGWATYLGAFFDASAVTVNNRGKSGCSSRTFYTGAAQWGTVPQQFSAGDYLIIQFAHNDEKNDGMDVDTLNAYYTSIGHALETDLRGTHPQTTYKEFLRKYINEARAAQVNPILMAPVARKYFNGTTAIKRSGLHDLGDKFWRIENGVLNEKASVPASDKSMDYVQAMREVAAEMNVPFLDMTTSSAEIYLQYGEAQCTELLFCKGDNTHFATMGANLIARRAAQMIKDSIPALAPYVSIPTSITVTPTELNLGEVYCGISITREVLLTGFGLQPETGTVSISATDNLQLSLDNETFVSSADASYAGATLFQRVYVRANYTEEGAQDDTIYISSGATHLEVPVIASTLSLEGGTVVQAKWTLAAKPSSLPLAAVCEGPISGEMTLSQIIAADTKSDAIDSEGNTTTVVRFHNADAAGKKADWPSDEIDENASRYIDFAISAPSTLEVRVTSISLQIGAYSTGFMKCHINTGFGTNFTDVHTIYEASQTALPNTSPDKSGNPGSPLLALNLTPTLTIPAGNTLHVRVLPWHEHTSGSGKYICLKDVVINGMAFEPSEAAVESTDVDPSKVNGKVLRDGQILIRHGDALYTITGTKLP